MSIEVLWCVWLFSLPGYHAQWGFDHHFGRADSRQPFAADPSGRQAFSSRDSTLRAREAIVNDAPGSRAFDAPSGDDGYQNAGGSLGFPGSMNPMNSLGMLGSGFGGMSPHLDFCRKCPACVSCTGMRVNTQTRPDSIFLGAFVGPRKHSANLHDLANHALQEHLGKFGLSPLTINVVDCRVRSTAFRGFIKLCECSGLRVPEFQVSLSNLGRMFYGAQKNL